MGVDALRRVRGRTAGTAGGAREGGADEGRRGATRGGVGGTTCEGMGEGEGMHAFEGKAWSDEVVAIIGAVKIAWMIVRPSH